MTKLAEESRFKKSNAGEVPAGSRKSRAAFCFSLSFVLLTNLKQAEGLGALTGDQNKSLNNFMITYIVLQVENVFKKTKQNNNGKWAPDSWIPVTSGISYFGSLWIWLQMKGQGTLHCEFVFWSCY